MATKDSSDMQLREMCKISRARWAVWLVWENNQWQFFKGFGINKNQQNYLVELIHRPQIVTWFSGAMSSGRTRSRDISANVAQLDCHRIYIFPNTSHGQILLVGVNRLEKDHENVWRVIALGNPPNTASVQPDYQERMAPNSDHKAENESKAPYDPLDTLRNILESVANTVPCSTAYLAIRYGVNFRILAIFNLPPEIHGNEIPIQSYPILENMINSKQGLVLKDMKLTPQVCKQDASITLEQAWMGIPICYGQRVIGLFTFTTYETSIFNSNLLEQTTHKVNRLAHTVENAIMFTELSRYLQQFALLNELATTASLGMDIEEVSQRVMHRMRRIFNTDWAAVLLLSPDGKTLREYGGKTSNRPPWNIPVETSLVGLAVEKGLPVNVGEVINQTRYYPTAVNVHSELAVPLKYRGRIIGAMLLVSTESNTFSNQDEQLLVVIASHLAGLFENMRLNEETRERAARLQDSVRQLQTVREMALDITSDLDFDTLLKSVVHRARDLVEARGAELGLFDSGEQTVKVVVSDTPWENIQGIKIPLMEGIAGRMAATGEPIVIADYNQWEGRLLPDRIAPFITVAGVPLIVKNQVIGTLTVIDDRPEKTFRENDVRLLELLAPQAAISIRNARLYQELAERIEAQRQAENHLLRSARLAAVGEMAAGVAHELNNPLTTVTGFVELVLEELDLSSPHRSDLELVLQEAHRARGVVRRLLDFSRPAENQRVKTDINELVNQTLTLVNHLARTSGVILNITPENNLPWIPVDANQIKQVLVNLLHNALQAMPKGGILTVKTSLIQRDNQEWLAIAVQDTGEGILPKHLGRIFEPFFTTRPDNKGTGLGLSVSYGIINSHNGTIEVESKVGSGSCFTIFLPTKTAGEE